MSYEHHKMEKDNTHLFSAAVVLVAFTRLPNALTLKENKLDVFRFRFRGAET